MEEKDTVGQKRGVGILLNTMENEAEGQGLTQVGVVVTRQNRVLI